MHGWSGRVDQPVTWDTLRWHQAMQEAESGSRPGVVLQGFAVDEGVRRNGGRVGAALGPAALRAALANLPVTDDAPLYDSGDVDCPDGDLESAQAHFGRGIAAWLDAGHLPVGLGGGHEIAFATYQGLARHMAGRGKRVAIVNLDAHFDLRQQAQASSGTPFLQAIEHAAQNGLPLDYLCLGVSTSANTRQLFKTADEHGVFYRSDEELTLLSLSARIEELLERLERVDAIYLTICLDVLPPASAPGVSAPSARGVPLEVVEPLLDAIASTGKVVVMDMAELSPPFDRDNVTARTAARLLHRCVRAILRAKSD